VNATKETATVETILNRIGEMYKSAGNKRPLSQIVVREWLDELREMVSDLGHEKKPSKPVEAPAPHFKAGSHPETKKGGEK